MNQEKITWETFDVFNSPKSNDWFWGLGIIALTGIVLSIYFKNYSFAILIAVASLAIFLASKRQPKIVQYEINRRGIKIGDMLYTFGTLISFHIIDETPDRYDRVLIRSKKAFMPILTVPLAGAIDPMLVRDYLIQYLHEEDMDEPFSHLLTEKLGI
jgi:hypothetical protein